MKKHLLIAGTGRAGTSFLVRYLSGIGLETHLSQNPEHATWDNNAHAGLENIPIKQQNLPYVIKTTWLGQFIEQVLASPDIQIDAVIIPIRDLLEAATSRVVNAMRTIHEHTPQMVDMDKTWDAWGFAKGGSIFSLNPLDQARLLAFDFHRLIYPLVRAEIPIIFLEFPKLVQNGEYLFKKLQSFLPPHLTEEEAIRIHKNIADQSKVRVHEELNEDVQEDTVKPIAIKNNPSHLQLDNIALRREIKRLRTELQQKELEIERMIDSHSWKITAWLRAVKKWAKVIYTSSLSL